MKIQNNLGKTAFSLIEISVVILIIGILVIGVSKGSRVINASRLSAAKSLTKNSSVLLTSDLIMWYEPVLETSFNDIDKADGRSLSNINGGSWFNNAISKDNNATNGTTAPKYVQYSTNNLPAVRFDGDVSSATLDFGTSALNQQHATVFVVERRSGIGPSTNRFINLGGGAYVLGYLDTDTLTMQGFAARDVAAFSSGVLIPRIITLLLGPMNTASRGIFVNGGVGSISAGTASDAVMSIVSTGIVGRGVNASYYKGDISEIIIFNRALRLSERNNIQEYLGEKYGIKVTPSS